MPAMTWSEFLSEFRVLTDGAQSISVMKYSPGYPVPGMRVVLSLFHDKASMQPCGHWGDGRPVLGGAGLIQSTTAQELGMHKPFR